MSNDKFMTDDDVLKHLEQGVSDRAAAREVVEALEDELNYFVENTGKFMNDVEYRAIKGDILSRINKANEHLSHAAAKWHYFHYEATKRRLA